MNSATYKIALGRRLKKPLQAFTDFTEPFRVISSLLSLILRQFLSKLHVTGWILYQRISKISNLESHCRTFQQHQLWSFHFDFNWIWKDNRFDVSKLLQIPVFNWSVPTNIEYEIFHSVWNTSMLLKIKRSWYLVFFF